MSQTSAAIRKPAEMPHQHFDPPVAERMHAAASPRFTGVTTCGSACDRTPEAEA